MSHRNVAHVFSSALKGSDEYEQEVPKALYGDRTGRYFQEVYLFGGQPGYCNEYCDVRLSGTLSGAGR